MMVFYGGKQRAGKTKVVVIELVRVLRQTVLAIVTNIALELKPWVDGGGVARKGLLRELTDRFGETFDAERRIRFLQPEEVGRFYGVRPRLPREDWGAREERSVSKHPDGRFHYDGDRYQRCVYAIDEAHDYFPGAAIGGGRAEGFDVSETLSWASQSARIGDEVHMISQVPKNVNKRVRDMCQECWWMTNHRHMSVGPFRQPDWISYRVFQTTPPGESETPLRVGKLRYDREFIDSIYNSNKGNTVVGTTIGDIGVRAHGLPLYTVPIAIGCVCVGAYFGYKGIINWAKKFGAPGVSGVAQGLVATAVPSLPGVSASNVLTGLGPGVVGQVFSGLPEDGKRKVWLTGVSRLNGKLRVCLSDGRILHEGDPELKAITGQFAVIGGQRVDWRPWEKRSGD